MALKDVAQVDKTDSMDLQGVDLRAVVRVSSMVPLLVDLRDVVVVVEMVVVDSVGLLPVDLVDLVGRAVHHPLHLRLNKV